MRYFYRLGQFTRHSQKVNKHSRKMEFIVPEKYDNCGWDVRSWSLDNILKETTEEHYNEILILENKIKKQQIEMELKNTGHHYPIKLSNKEIENFKNIGFKILEL